MDVLLLLAGQISTNGEVKFNLHLDKIGHAHVSIIPAVPDRSEHDPETTPKIFSELEETQSANFNPKRIELDLANMILQANGTQLCVDIESGKGSSFHFTLKSIK